MGSTQREQVVNEVAIGIVAVVAIVFVVSRLKGAQAADAPPQPIDAESLEAVRLLLRAGRKINALKIYREATGASLKAAKDAVEALAEGRQAPEPSRGFDAAAHNAVREALLAGQKIHAIKLYREATGVGLKEAKEAVEAMAVNEGFDA